ncbi:MULTISPECIES: hypothetical protein [unclassified Janthinobacterium]|uniref:hypothetical protein n=1 Tax=unclassified Janthinobacterium TaxID=2610881 RepID=UPI000349FBEE|nr:MULTISPECIES: hypothetical protein [unclassified Janthinobacterium]MEC5161758.1 hypothetical protein [Janthinobacterium sp. CG_S6]
MRVNERQTGAPDFISTRKDYRGVDLSAADLETQHGGAGKRTASISAGYGDFGRDGVCGT